MYNLGGKSPLRHHKNRRHSFSMPSNSDIHCCSQNVERKRTEESARRRNRLPPVKTNTSTSWMTSFSKTLPETENEHKPTAFILYAKQLGHSLLFVECWEEENWGISSEKKSFTSGEDEYIDLVDDFFFKDRKRTQVDNEMEYEFCHTLSCRNSSRWYAWFAKPNQVS